MMETTNSVASGPQVGPPQPISDDIDLHYLLTGEKSPPGVLIEPEYNGMTLLEACKRGNLPTIAMLLLAGAGNYVRDKSGHQASVLHWVSFFGHPDLIQYIIGRGVDVNDTVGEGVVTPKALGSERCDTNGQTPLMCAAAGGHMNAIQILLQCGANIDVVDAGGHNVAFYAMGSPLTLHFLKTNGANLLKCANDGSTILHRITAGNYRMSATYLFEKVEWEDINARDHKKRTPLHYAAMASQREMVRMLVNHGADISLTDEDGKTAEDVAVGTTTRALLRIFGKEVQSLKTSDLRNTAIARPLVEVAPIPSGWSTWKNFFFAFTAPNIVLATASQLNGFIGMIVLLLAVVLLVKVTQAAARREGRDLSTTGWYMGALVCGSVIMIHKEWPVVIKTGHDQWKVAAWSAITLCMVACYFRVLLGDPGIVASSRDQRERIYQMAEAGILPDKTLYCIEAMVQKPNRSKYCKYTQRCVARFDHYCVWLGNSIGAKNHRYFLGFCFSQFFSQMFVFHWTYQYFKAAEGPTTLSFCNFIDFIFAPDRSIVAFFLIGYNLMALVFVTLVIVYQTKAIVRNFTSNEVWFPRRYPWIIQLGKQDINLYDAGLFTNLKELWVGRMHDGEYAAPPISPYINAKIEAYKKQCQTRGLPPPTVHGGCHAAGSHCCDVEAPSHAAQPLHAGQPPTSAACQHAGHPTSLPSTPEDIQAMQQQAMQMLHAQLGGAPGQAPDPKKVQEVQQMQHQFMAHFQTLPEEQKQMLMMQSMQKFMHLRQQLPGAAAQGVGQSAEAPAPVAPQKVEAESTVPAVPGGDRKKD
mmetsp:Transcript_77408/g.136524  ORF Transcript_77408/g.136524 Transcript_77408/m.136524 type:complete len:809 (-) Transcript_77408:354-2780(-)